VSNAAQQEQYKRWPGSGRWDPDLAQPGPWVLVLMAFMVAAAAIAWAMFLIG